MFEAPLNVLQQLRPLPPGHREAQTKVLSLAVAPPGIDHLIRIEVPLPGAEADDGPDPCPVQSLEEGAPGMGPHEGHRPPVLLRGRSHGRSPAPDLVFGQLGNVDRAALHLPGLGSAGHQGRVGGDPGHPPPVHPELPLHGVLEGPGASYRSSRTVSIP